MDWALRLSEQEASASALRQQQEEEAMKKAIQESVSTPFMMVLKLCLIVLSFWRMQNWVNGTI